MAFRVLRSRIAEVRAEAEKNRGSLGARVALNGQAAHEEESATVEELVTKRREARRERRQHGRCDRRRRGEPSFDVWRRGAFELGDVGARELDDPIVAPSDFGAEPRVGSERDAREIDHAAMVLRHHRARVTSFETPTLLRFGTLRFDAAVNGSSAFSYMSANGRVSRNGQTFIHV